MFATAICAMKQRKIGHERFNTGKLRSVLVGGIFFLAVVQQPLAAETNALATRAQTNFVAAQIKFSTNANDAKIAWEFGRACFDLAECATNKAQKAALAEQGIAACRRAIAIDPKCGPAHLYLGMTIGQVADTKRDLAALKMVKEMEAEFLIARDLDESFDHAGPDRNLGLLYFQSPIIVSVGNRTKARRHLERAVQLAPESPENHLNLIEAYLKWNEAKAAQRELKALENIWASAKEKFPDENWGNLEQRYNAVKTKIEGSAK
jgi:tetratricopeptide (TPR) repeat protein